ncbi:MAG: peptide-methionine (S)-S-oxide reductase [Ignavibacteriales bacterium CG12_big_fil_rev_8_21_14_0_65_30_8]|nr:MAG: peptide-methionine (S)-S-oxide reductase [Ignavibacteriales bacterium CG12_big_fil_rev_8_21_14_0_65_30_8]
MIEKATFGAGCFWGVQEEFDKLDGVIKTVVGYSGGNIKNPTYKIVCSGNTGHAEVLQVEFDNEKISYEELLRKFWNIHNPTTPNRQGPDIGSQYRSIILTHNKQQEEIALREKEFLEKSKKFNSKIVTEIVTIEAFFEAEDYHQKYYKKNKWF